MRIIILVFLAILATVVSADALSVNNKYFDAVPHYLGTARDGKSVSFSAKCFKLTTVTMIIGDNYADINIRSEKADHMTCADWGDHKFTIDLTPEEVSLTRAAGLHLFQISLNVIDYIRDVVELYAVVKNGDPSAVKKLVEDQMGFRYQEREVGWIEPDLIEPYVNSGDLISVLKFNDVEAIIMSATLSRAGHTAQFLRDPDTNKLYVVEAQPEGGWMGGNVFRTPFNDWMRALINGSFDNCNPDICHAVWLPLTDQARSHFDERKAWEYFLVAEAKYPYSSFAEAFSGIDSVDPHSWAYPLSPALLPFVGVLADTLFPEARDMYLLKGFEKRLGVKEGYFKSFAEILEYCNDRQLDIVEIAVQPEMDHWTYGGYPSLQCSSLAAAILKAGGVFDGLTGGKGHLVQATEFTPRDIYQLGIFREGRPAVCDVDDLPYCQILGKNKVELVGWNSVFPYPTMNERCFINPVLPRTPDMC
ncbi:hypothetical protein GEMRC1_007066 [Eukaryota sp. GEM-RC1]